LDSNPRPSATNVKKLDISHEKCQRKSKKIARKSEANVVVAKNEVSECNFYYYFFGSSEQIERIILVTSSLRAMQV